MSTTSLRRPQGFGIVAAIVILVILSGLAGFIVSLSTSQNTSLAQDVQGAKAYQAARSGLEWGTAVWLGTWTDEGVVGNNCIPSSPATLSGLDGGFQARVEGSCAPAAACGLKYRASPPLGDPAYLQPGIRVFCRITSTATTTSSPGALGYVERELSSVIEGPNL